MERKTIHSFEEFVEVVSTYVADKYGPVTVNQIAEDLSWPPSVIHAALSAAVQRADLPKLIELTVSAGCPSLWACLERTRLPLHEEFARYLASRDGLEPFLTHCRHICRFEEAHAVLAGEMPLTRGIADALPALEATYWLRRWNREFTKEVYGILREAADAVNRAEDLVSSIFAKKVKAGEVTWDDIVALPELFPLTVEIRNDYDNE